MIKDSYSLYDCTPASVRVMEKVGMEFDKFAPYEPEGEDVVWYWCDKKLITKNKSY